MFKNIRKADIRKSKRLKSRKCAKRVGTVNKKLPREKSTMGAVTQKSKNTLAKQLMSQITGIPSDTPLSFFADVGFLRVERQHFRGKNRHRYDSMRQK